MIYPKAFAEQYTTAWSNGDLDAITGFFDAEGELRSPFSKLFVGAGVIRGHSALRTFCDETFRRRPNMKLELLDVFSGHDSISLLIRDEASRLTIFTAIFTPAGKIALGILCYNKNV